MGPPLLIGAGLGAATSLAMGKNPFMGALLGGATGGAFGGAGGFGSGFGFGEGGLLSGLKGIAPEAVSLGSGGYAQLAQAPLGSIGGISGGIQLKPLMNQAVNTADDIIANPNLIDDMVSRGFNGTNLPANNQIAFKDFYPTTNLTDDALSFGKPLSSADQMFANKFVTETNPLALDPRRMAVDTPLSFGERLSDIGSNAFSYAKENPTSLLSGANTISDMSANAEAQNQQKLNNAVAMGAQPIATKDFDPSSVIAAAPSYGLSRDEVAAGKVAQIASQARLNDEDVRKIRQFYPSLIG